MRVLKPLRSLVACLLAAGFALPVAGAGCGADAVGVQDCRDIEYARCESGKACGVVSDVEACKRFYRDHCLHGLALKDAPNGATVSACVSSLKAVGACGKDVNVNDCSGVTASATSAVKACDVLTTPEVITECAFLVPKTPEVPKDASAESEASSDSGSSDSGLPDAGSD